MRPILLGNARLWFGLLLGALACSPAAEQGVRTQQRLSANGHPYSLFYADSFAVRVVTTRPQLDRSPYQLSVAAAYTDLATDQPLDLLVCGGRVLQAQAKVGFLDGVLTIMGDTLSITALAKGQTPPAAQLERVRRRHGTLLLQELVVWQGQNQRAAGGSWCQRRALVELAAHRFAVIESAFDSLSMQQFGQDLVALGARNALYLDMGDWDEGWCRTSEGVVLLGMRRYQTSRQSNWLVFVPSAAVATP